MFFFIFNLSPNFFKNIQAKTKLSYYKNPDMFIQFLAWNSEKCHSQLFADFSV